MKFKKIGIIGGMGPESTVLLYKYLIKDIQHSYNSYLDCDYPEIIIHSLPIPDITKDVNAEHIIKSMFRRTIDLFERNYVEIIVFPCNTLDYFIDFIRMQTKITVLSIVEETCERIRKKDPKEVLLLSTPTTFGKGLYHRYLRDTNIVRPENYRKVLDVIVRTLKGENPREEFIEMLEREYSEYNNIVIGCTDLSILVEDYKNDKLIDSVKCLSDAIMKKSLQKYLK
ncbi:MAG: amino acid racemase [Bacteroidales bacterium]|nr:amino acid racemase [Bacteroidales bacterium]